MTTSSCISTKNFSGEYHLTGVHEIASGFNFTPDGEYEFYDVYGAMDRASTGTYTIEGDTIKLKSKKNPWPGFQHQSKPEEIEEKEKAEETKSSVLSISSISSTSSVLKAQAHKSFETPITLLHVEAPCALQNTQYRFAL